LIAKKELTEEMVFRKRNLMGNKRSLDSLSLSLYGNAMLINPFHAGSIKTGRFFMKWVM